MRSYEVKIDADLSGVTVERVLRRVLRLSKTQMKRAKFQPDGLLLDGIRVNSDCQVKSGQTLQVRIPERETSQVVPAPGAVRILFEDPWLAVVDKPAGLPAHPGRGHYGDTLGNHLVWHYRQQGISMVPRFVSRLDKGTSGLLILAKSAESQERLQKLLHTSSYQRHYLAICQGSPPQETGVVTWPIGKRPGALNAYQVSDSGRLAETRFRVLDRRGKYSLVALTLKTGRTHQIRVHLSALGCPLAGDPLYGGGKELERPALHACRIVLRHPFTHQDLQFTSPMPKDLEHFWRNQR